LTAHSASIAGSGNHTLTSGLNDLAWACAVLTSFPRAILIMAGTFELWRGGLISNTLFAGGVAAVVFEQPLDTIAPDRRNDPELGKMGTD
jgi:hypothetical protein